MRLLIGCFIVVAGGVGCKCDDDVTVIRKFVDRYCQSEFDGSDAFRINCLVPPPGDRRPLQATEAYGLVDYSMDPLWIIRSYSIQEPVECLKDRAKVRIRFEVIGKTFDRAFMRRFVFNPETEFQTLQLRRGAKGWVVVGPWIPKVGLAGMRARLEEDIARLRAASLGIAQEKGLRGNMFRELVKTLGLINEELQKK